MLWQTVTRLNLKTSPTKRPAEIADVDICAVSGDLVGRFCPHRAKGLFITGVSPITACTVHQEIFLDSKGQRLAQDDGFAQRKICEVWSAQRIAQFQHAGLPRASVPALPEDSGAPPRATSPPRIVSPQPTLTYLLRPNDPAKNLIPLDADPAPGVRLVYWFAGPRYLGSSEPSKPLLWQPTVGRWQIQAVDEEGRSSQVTISSGRPVARHSNVELRKGCLKKARLLTV